MTLNKVFGVSATQKKDWKDTLLNQSLEQFNTSMMCNFIIENKEPLSVVYNEMIESALEKDADAVIFIHDDVWLEHDPIPKLERLFDQFDVVGLAGCTQAEIKAPALWHLMGGGLQGGNLRGAVAHGDGNVKHVTSFGQFPARVVMIDGLFMALNRKALETVRFDETNPAGFHFYDLDLSKVAYDTGLRVGVGDIFVTHSSPGLREFTPEFLKGQEWFLNKHGN